MNDDRRLAELAVNAWHASDRYRLHRARTHGRPHATSLGRLRELGREAELAKKLLSSANAARR